VPLFTPTEEPADTEEESESEGPNVVHYAKTRSGEDLDYEQGQEDAILVRHSRQADYEDVDNNEVGDDDDVTGEDDVIGDDNEDDELNDRNEDDFPSNSEPENPDEVGAEEARDGNGGNGNGEPEAVVDPFQLMQTEMEKAFDQLLAF